METRRETLDCQGTKISYHDDDGREIARAFLYVLKNDLHPEPFGFLEDVFVAADCRGQGLGTKINQEIIALARKLGCYKIVACSRDERKKVHELYRGLGYEKHGVEFRMMLRPKKKRGRK